MKEQADISASDEAASHKGEFFLIDSSFREDHQVPGIEIANEDKLIKPGMYVISRPNGDPDQYSERPHLAHLPEKGPPPRDLEELAGIWIVSKPLKQVLEQIDAKAFAFVACDFSLADGSQGPQYFLGNVLRNLNALDEALSKVKIKFEHNYMTGEDEKFYSIVGGASLVFNRDMVGRDTHVFRQEMMGAPPICDRVMFDALSDHCFSGVRLRDATDL